MTKLTQKSQVTVPKSIRKILKLRPGDEVDFTLTRNEVILHKKMDLKALDQYKGFLGKAKTKDIMKELRG